MRTESPGGRRGEEGGESSRSPVAGFSPLELDTPSFSLGGAQRGGHSWRLRSFSWWILLFSEVGDKMGGEDPRLEENHEEGGA